MTSIVNTAVIVPAMIIVVGAEERGTVTKSEWVESVAVARASPLELLEEEEDSVILEDSEGTLVSDKGLKGKVSEAKRIVLPLTYSVQG